MRVIIKNADFSVYGIADMSGLMSTLMTKFGGITSENKSVVEDFLRALGADGSNNIWSKIKHLYIPCLGITSDGDDALYDIISGNNFHKNGAVATSKIYDKRGVGVTTYGTEKGQTIGTESVSGITADNQSYFASFTRYPHQTSSVLSSSSGTQVVLGTINPATGIAGKWEVANMTCPYMGDSTKNIQVANPSGFSSPNWIVLSCRENGSRTMYTADGHTTSSALESYASAPGVAHISAGYVITSIFGVCAGLTASEAEAVSSAISTFVTAYGIDNTVS